MANKDNCSDVSSFDAYSPHEMACKAEKIGVTKANLGFLSTFMLSVLAGAFIAFGACFYTNTVTGSQMGFGFTKMLGGLAFSIGLILVVVAGAELFTGNTLIVIATVSRKVTFYKLLRNWGIVYFGNFIGSLATAALVYHAWQWKAGSMAVGVTAYNIAGDKMGHPFVTAFASGILCNALVCLAVWLCYSARSTTDKILSVIFPITAFIALGFEHCVANMYIIPYGIMLANTQEFAANPAVLSLLKHDPSFMTISNFLVKNLIPVTLGNIVGGSLLIGIMYWLIYLRGQEKIESESYEEVMDEAPDKVDALR